MKKKTIAKARRVRFLQDYRGVLTGEVPYLKGQIAFEHVYPDTDVGIDVDGLLADGRVELVEPAVEPKAEPEPEAKPKAKAK